MKLQRQERKKLTRAGISTTEAKQAYEHLALNLSEAIKLADYSEIRTTIGEHKADVARTRRLAADEKQRLADAARADREFEGQEALAV